MRRRANRRLRQARRPALGLGADHECDLANTYFWIDPARNVAGVHLRCMNERQASGEENGDLEIIDDAMRPCIGLGHRAFSRRDRSDRPQPLLFSGSIMAAAPRRVSIDH